MNGNKKINVFEWTSDCAVNAMKPRRIKYSSATVSCNNQPHPIPLSCQRTKRTPINTFSRIFSKTTAQMIAVSTESVASLVERCVEQTDTIITMDSSTSNRCNLPTSCHRNIDQCHLIHSFFERIANASFSCHNYSLLNPSLAFKNLNGTIPLSDGICSIFRVKRDYFHGVSQILLSFDVAKEKARITWLIKKYPRHQTDLTALFFAVHCIAYLKAFHLVLFRTEDFDKKVKNAVLEMCRLFFANVQFDVGHGKSSSHISDYIPVLQDSEVDNYSTQLSTESSYHFGHCLHIAKKYDVDDISKFHESLSGVYLCAVNADYGCTYVKELL